MSLHAWLGFVLALVWLTGCTALQGSCPPGLKRFGVGARVRRDEKGARLSTVFMFEGVPCK